MRALNARQWHRPVVPAVMQSSSESQMGLAPANVWINILMSGRIKYVLHVTINVRHARPLRLPVSLVGLTDKLRLPVFVKMGITMMERYQHVRHANIHVRLVQPFHPALLVMKLLLSESSKYRLPIVLAKIVTFNPLEAVL